MLSLNILCLETVIPVRTEETAGEQQTEAFGKTDTENVIEENMESVPMPLASGTYYV